MLAMVESATSEEQAMATAEPDAAGEAVGDVVGDGVGVDVGCGDADGVTVTVTVGDGDDAGVDGEHPASTANDTATNDVAEVMRNARTGRRKVCIATPLNLCAHRDREAAPQTGDPRFLPRKGGGPAGDARQHVHVS
ncbi:hypothetical protein B7R25_09180 [Subtercola boreus]|uniref:Uncharacterized protein n=1 Tax=Subtercola boreus TaxID=120213 RepID=A0A3E0WBP8_9MICO|nr:hypothetical protein B7R24_09115 [Subtercola boreus]RFA20696.1 hypothetical protein B7R23_09050 [Subtercola boreus]RFA26906.1 hypothetical protein B7R25_09180 [Subtercola boreus]